MEEFLSADIQKIMNMKRNRLEQWIALGFISPSIQEASGPGTRNVWSRNDLYTIAVFKEILESGLSRKLALDFLSKGTVSIFSDKEINDIGFLIYMRSGSKTDAAVLYYDDSDEVKIDIVHIQDSLGLRPFNNCFIVNFQNLKQAVDAKILKVKV